MPGLLTTDGSSDEESDSFVTPESAEAPEKAFIGKPSGASESSKAFTKTLSNFENPVDYLNNEVFNEVEPELHEFRDLNEGLKQAHNHVHDNVKKSNVPASVFSRWWELAPSDSDVPLLLDDSSDSDSESDADDEKDINDPAAHADFSMIKAKLRWDKRPGRLSGRAGCTKDCLEQLQVQTAFLGVLIMNYYIVLCVCVCVFSGTDGSCTEDLLFRANNIGIRGGETCVRSCTSLGKND